MRILQIAKHFAPDFGGIETVTKDLSEGFAAEGLQADVLCVEFQPPYEAFIGSYRVIRTKSDLNMGNKRISFDYVRKIAALEPDYDVAIVHMPHPLAVMGVLRGWRKPFVLLWHADTPQATVRRLFAPFDRRAIAAANGILAPTSTHIAGSSFQRELEAHPKSFVVPLPFDQTRLPPPDVGSDFADQIRAFARGRKIVLSTGRMVPYKGYDVLIAAAKMTTDDTVFVIAGDGPVRAQTEAAVERNGLEQKVLLPGRISDLDLSTMLELCHIGCMPSVSAAEMYGLAQVEAMSRRKPVVSTNLPRSGVPCVNRDGETGLLAEPGDPYSLAHCINLLASDQGLYTRLSEGAYRAFTNEHRLKAVIDRYIAILGSITK